MVVQLLGNNYLYKLHKETVWELSRLRTIAALTIHLVTVLEASQLSTHTALSESIVNLLSMTDQHAQHFSGSWSAIMTIVEQVSKSVNKISTNMNNVCMNSIVPVSVAMDVCTQLHHNIDICRDMMVEFLANLKRTLSRDSNFLSSMTVQSLIMQYPPTGTWFKRPRYREVMEHVQNEIHPSAYVTLTVREDLDTFDTHWEALMKMPGIAGFFGASSIERLPTERAIRGQVQDFKALRLAT